MSKLTPVGDIFMIEVGSLGTASEDNPMGLVGSHDPDEGVRGGRVVAVSDELAFFGFVTFMFDNSLMNKELLGELYDHFKKYLGKKVYWPERSESGTVLEHEGKQYAFVKWSAIMAVEDL
jgi:hypothetical protein